MTREEELLDKKDYQLLSTCRQMCENLIDVVALVTMGANINVRGRNGLTPIMCAAVQGHLSIVKYLARRGADLTARSKFERYDVIMCAAEYHSIDVLEFLLDFQNIKYEFMLAHSHPKVRMLVRELINERC